MATKVKKKKPSTALVRETPKNLPVALDAARNLVSMLDAVTGAVANMPTEKLTELVAAMKPVEKSVKTMNDKTRSALIDRVMHDDPAFQRVGNTSMVDVGDLTVSLRENERMIEVDGAVQWLRLHHGAQFAILTKREIRVTDAESVARVLDDLTTLTNGAAKGRVRVEDIVPLLSQLHGVIEREDRLNEKAIEKAVKGGSLTQDDLQHLYKLEGKDDPSFKPSYTMTVTPKKDTANAND